MNRSPIICRRCGLPVRFARAPRAIMPPKLYAPRLYVPRPRWRPRWRRYPALQASGIGKYGRDTTGKEPRTADGKVPRFTVEDQTCCCPECQNCATLPPSVDVSFTGVNVCTTCRRGSIVEPYMKGVNAGGGSWAAGPLTVPWVDPADAPGGTSCEFLEFFDIGGAKIDVYGMADSTCAGAIVRTDDVLSIHVQKVGATIWNAHLGLTDDVTGASGRGTQISSAAMTSDSMDCAATVNGANGLANCGGFPDPFTMSGGGGNVTINPNL